MSLRRLPISGSRLRDRVSVNRAIEITRASAVAGPENRFKQSSLHIALHVVACHLERHDLNGVAVGRDVRLQSDVMAFMTLDRIRVVDRPTLAILIAYEGLAVVADFARDAGSLR